MGEIVNVKDLTHIMLWSDGETAYKVRSYEIVGNKKLSIRTVLERVKPFPHLINDEWSFPATADGGEIMVDLDFYTQHQPAKDAD